MKFKSLTTFVAVGVLLLGSLPSQAAPPPVLTGSVSVCDPNAPTHCSAPTSAGAIPVTVSGTPAITGTVKIDQTTPGTTNGVQINAALPAGTAVIGKTGIDQTTPGTTNGVQVNAALPAGTAIIGKVGFDQTTPGTTNNVVQDGVLDAATTSNSVTSAATVLSLATVGYATGSFHITSIGTTNTITFEQSNDNSNWVPLNTCNTPVSFVTGCANGTSTTTGLYSFPVVSAFVRARVSTYTSGTVTIFGTLKRTNSPQGITVNGGSGNGLVVQGSGAGNALPVFPKEVATQITAASGNVANANAVATLAGVSAKTTFIRGFRCQASGATAASVVSLTITGTITGTLTYTFVFPAGITTVAEPVGEDFGPYGIAASTTNTAVVVTLPAGGTGNTNATCVAYGYQQ